MDEIQRRTAPYYEWEQHSSWNIFKNYTSPRRGLHLYPTKNGFQGYYETGERNRTDELQRAKAWVSIKIKEKNGERIISGYTYFCPILIILLLVAFVDLFTVPDMPGFLFVSVICAILLVSKIKEEHELIACVKKILEQ